MKLMRILLFTLTLFGTAIIAGQPSLYDHAVNNYQRFLAPTSLEHMHAIGKASEIIKQIDEADRLYYSRAGNCRKHGCILFAEERKVCGGGRSIQSQLILQYCRRCRESDYRQKDGEDMED